MISTEIKTTNPAFSQFTTKKAFSFKYINQQLGNNREVQLDKASLQVNFCTDDIMRITADVDQ